MTTESKPLQPSTYGTSSSTGGFNWDSGHVAFSDPMEEMLKRESKREAERKRPTKRGKKLRTGMSGNSKHFHLKHG
jgi:hypothetical protein